jgi:hypothetical protein
VNVVQGLAGRSIPPTPSYSSVGVPWPMGKSKLAKALTKQLFDDENLMHTWSNTLSRIFLSKIHPRYLNLSYLPASLTVHRNTQYTVTKDGSGVVMVTR